MANGRETRVGLDKLRQTYQRMTDSMIRSDESGWRFYDAQGRRFSLSPAEGAVLRAEARARIDTLFRGLEGSSWLMLVPAVLVGTLGIRMAREFTAVGGMPTAVYFIPCLLFLFKDAFAEVGWILATARWREDKAAELRRRDGREHEAVSYTWIFDPRLPRWAGFGLSAVALTGLLIMAHLPLVPTALVLAGLVLIGGALLGITQAS